MAVPLAVCIALACWTPSTEEAADEPAHEVITAPLSRRVGAVLLCASLLIAIPVSATPMLNQRIGNQQLQFGLTSLISPGPNVGEPWYRRLLINEREPAGYFDRKHLPTVRY